MPRSVTVLLIVLAALNLVDIAIHVAIDQVEPLRVTSNVVVIVAVVALFVAKSVQPVALRRAFVLPLLVGLIYLALNLTFIALESIGPLGAMLVIATTLLLAALAVVLARARKVLAA